MGSSAFKGTGKIWGFAGGEEVGQEVGTPPSPVYECPGENLTLPLTGLSSAPCWHVPCIAQMTAVVAERSHVAQRRWAEREAEVFQRRSQHAVGFKLFLFAYPGSWSRRNAVFSLLFTPFQRICCWPIRRNLRYTAELETCTKMRLY